MQLGSDEFFSNGGKSVLCLSGILCLSKFAGVGRVDALRHQFARLRQFLPRLLQAYLRIFSNGVGVFFAMQAEFVPPQFAAARSDDDVKPVAVV